MGVTPYRAEYDESDFRRYREQVCSDALTSLCGLMGVGGYLQLLGTLLTVSTAGGGTEWQRVEAVLFGTRAVHLEVTPSCGPSFIPSFLLSLHALTLQSR